MNSWEIAQISPSAEENYKENPALLQLQLVHDTGRWREILLNRKVFDEKQEEEEKAKKKAAPKKATAKSRKGSATPRRSMRAAE